MKIVSTESSYYHAVIERPDGSTYIQLFTDFDNLQELKRMLGDDYWIVEIF